ncbi:DUF192 domain-containing protein [Alkalinema sp. FACHB-956]|uniref:DUF192 domain-containing protein n=1 Tax=Alkalinema sp. FACHB-956 TaxID=2692768 RepID=UPI001681DE1E|nr:DUF192 domain-containing protein [Alkalinema sp. FACHB-956]MBD2328737.1 DUF192 domain-containing protein [Alkalinema sp. FACHB-956]
MNLRSTTIGLSCLGLSMVLLGCAPSSTVNVPIASAAPVAASAKVGQYLPVSAQAKIADQIIRLEVASTPQQQAMGLMYRPALSDDQGMLFPFSPARTVNFWMKNVPVPLDMVFLYQGKVVAIADQVPPCETDASTCPTYGPNDLVDQVIELRAGRAQTLNLQVGDRITVTFLQPQG